MTEERNKLLDVERANLVALDNKLTQLKTAMADDKRDTDVKIRKITKESQEKLSLLVTKEDIERVYRRFNDFAEKQDLVKHQNDIKPMVERCKESQAKFVYEHMQMKEMIRRFDEVLGEKANKMAITELEHRIGEGFLK